jgi:hypothetical protein
MVEVPTLFLGAIFEEVRALAEHLDGAERLPGPVTALRGGLAGRPVAVAVVGEGARAAAAGTRALLARLSPARAVRLGFVGALSPALPPLTLVEARAVHDARRLPRLATRLDLAPRVDVWSAPRLLAAAADKARLAEHLGGRGPWVVDLETAAIAGALADAGLGWSALGVVTDGLGESLPSPVADSQGPDGAVDRAGVVLRALRRPAAWPALVALERRARAASRVLAAAAALTAG